MTKLIATTILMMLTIVPSMAQSATSLLRQASDRLAASKGTEVTFSFDSAEGTETGKMYLKGEKFCITSPSVTNIYNGTDLWSANAATSEINVYTPEEEELAEINPMSIIINSTSMFDVRKLSGPATEHRLLLTPKDSDFSFRKVVLTLKASTGLPSRLTLTAPDGTEAVFRISEIKLNENISPTRFVFNKGNFKGYKLIDLR